MPTARSLPWSSACLGGLLLAGCATGPLPPSTAQPRLSASAHTASCAADAGVMDGWDTPAPPHTVFANVHYVGTCGITAVLLTSAQGHILIDGGTPAAGPAIAASIQALGYRLEDIGYLLVSHEHYDHAGGLAWLQQASGAVVLARPAAVDALRRGHNDRSDPQSGALDDFPAIANVRAIGDGQTVRLGPLAVTAHATPGHAPGGAILPPAAVPADGVRRQSESRVPPRLPFRRPSRAPGRFARQHRHRGRPALRCAAYPASAGLAAARAPAWRGRAGRCRCLPALCRLCAPGPGCTPGRGGRRGRAAPLSPVPPSP